jgi:RNA polymerase primary sigma factor
MVSVLANKPDVTTEEDMRQFMEEIRRFPLLQPEEERALACRSAQGDEDAIRQLVNANLRLVVAIARRYYSGAVPLLDLVQEGAIGLLAAARKFDYTREVRFSTYATKWIRQGVIRCVVNHSNPIRVPAHTAALIRRVTEAQLELRQRLEREPELEEIAVYCQMPADKVTQLLQLQPKTCSLDDPAGEQVGLALVEDIRTPQPQEALVREELIRTMEQLLAKLNERQQRILRLRFGMEDGKCHSLDDVGHILGISKERARQVEKQAMEKLKKLGADMGLEDFLE